MTDPAELLRGLFDAAIAAAKPSAAHFAPLPTPPRGRTIVLGAGKAAAGMTAAFEDALEAADWSSPVSGVVVTRYGHQAPTRHVTVREAAHPVPDAAGRAATAEILAEARRAGPDDLVVFLISGGASALLIAPAAGLDLEGKARVNQALLRCGAPIDEMNAVRSALSEVKGGKLARAAAAAGAAVTYAISDVPGDAPAVIGSGPTAPPAAGGRGAAEILARYGIAEAAGLDPSALQLVAPAPADARYPAFRLVAAPQISLEAAAAAARAAGVTPLILGDAIEGESREAAVVLAGVAAQIGRHGQPCPAPCVILTGGETTVTVRGGGRGGPNAEFALALALALEKGPVAERVWAIAGDTDGVDGAGEAGAAIGPGLLAAARAQGLDPRAALDDNDAYGFFDAIGATVVTGPTNTNVNDFRAIYVGPG